MPQENIYKWDDLDIIYLSATQVLRELERALGHNLSADPLREDCAFYKWGGHASVASQNGPGKLSQNALFTMTNLSNNQFEVD